MSERRIADGRVGHSLVRVEAGEGTMVIEQVFAKIRTQNTPVCIVIDVVRLGTVDKGYIQCAVCRQVVGAHCNRLTCRTDGAVSFVPGQYRVPDGHVGAFTDVDKPSVRRSLLTFAGNAVLQSFQGYIRATYRNV